MPMQNEDNEKHIETDLNDPKYYFNREISLLEFNRRVLMEAADHRHPLLERLKFSSIVSSNLDEFFMVRVAGLKRQISAGVVDLSYDGKTPEEQLKEIRETLIPLYKDQEHIWDNDIYPKMQEAGINIHSLEDLNDEEKAYLKDYFCENVLPVLTPLSLDPGHPFPRIINRALNIMFVLSDKVKRTEPKRIAFLQIPILLDRFISIKRESGYHFVLMEQIIKEYADMLFPGLHIEESYTFRVIRDADIEIADDEAEDLLTEIAEQIKQRKWGTSAVRMDVSQKMPEYLINMLIKSFELDDNDIYVRNRPLNFPDFMQLAKLDIREMHDKPFRTKSLPEFWVDNASVFDAMKKTDLLVHHPYDSFTNNVLRFINESADDPDVIAMKMTLYRTGLNSPIVAALKRAAESGKDVTAFVELKARFDEENNIIWAKELEQVGVHVIYGVLGLKTHAKIAYVVRRESGKMRTYLHLATGNYNHVTSRLYTDIGFFTSRKDFGEDATHLFNYLTGYSYHENWNQFLVAPVNLRQRVIELIEKEAEHHTPENPGLIFAKMNSLAHRDVSIALYKASQKGVRIKLLVRGVCCLKPGIPGVSENIEVRSILGRFLEHSRIFYFKSGGEDKYFLSSADWMTRNLHRRVELMFPIHDEKIKNKIKHILDVYWKDNTKSWRLKSDGSYEKLSPGKDEEPLIAQEYFLREIKESKNKIPSHNFIQNIK